MPRRNSTGAEVIASTAGQDNWQTWAGRSHGSAGFEFLDLFRGAKRQFNRKFVWGIPPAGTACPVCYTVPETKGEWHVTTSCGHAVCKDCLRGYAASLVQDTTHHGPLRCPVCPLPLRPKDAITALNDPELLRMYDAKIRDEMLRALPGYRHCPRCNGTNHKGDDKNNNNNNEKSTPSSSILKGGGFVTPECLAPINKERERQALVWLDHPLMKQQAVLVMYILWLYMYLRDPSSSIFVDILNTSVVPFWLLRRIWLVGRYIVAYEARKILFKPLSVECPCCDESFILNAESELGNNVITDEATEKWIGSNSRPCPSCSVPIEKSEGCNHMQCAHCRAKFCWACMRVGTFCKAFNCSHGAPFGDAGALDETRRTQDQGELGILDRIDRIANASTQLDHRDGIAFGAILLGFLARESRVVQITAAVIVKTFAFIFSTATIPTLVLGFVLSTRFSRDFRRFFRIPEVTLRDVMDGSAQGRVAERVFDVDNAVERRLVEEVIQRSLIEQ